MARIASIPFRTNLVDCLIASDILCRNNKMPSNYCASDACLCCWTDITADAAIVEREESLTDCLFYVDVEECCLAAIGEDSLGFGLITNKDANECGKVSTGCVACGVGTARHQVSWHLVNLGKAKG